VIAMGQIKMQKFIAEVPLPTKLHGRSPEGSSVYSTVATQQPSHLIAQIKSLAEWFNLRRYWPTATLSGKFHANPLGSFFCAMLLTDRQTNNDDYITSLVEVNVGP